MLVDDVGAECGVYGDGNSPLGGGEQEGDVAGRELGAAREVVGERFAHTLAGARAVGDRGVHLAPGLLHHAKRDRKSTRLNSSHTVISYAVFCLKKKKNNMPERRITS